MRKQSTAGTASSMQVPKPGSFFVEFQDPKEGCLHLMYSSDSPEKGWRVCKKEGSSWEDYGPMHFMHVSTLLQKFMLTPQHNQLALLSPALRYVSPAGLLEIRRRIEQENRLPPMTIFCDVHAGWVQAEDVTGPTW